MFTLHYGQYRVSVKLTGTCLTEAPVHNIFTKMCYITTDRERYAGQDVKFGKYNNHFLNVWLCDEHICLKFMPFLANSSVTQVAIYQVIIF